MYNVKPPREYDNHTADYALLGFNEGLFIVVLEDINGGWSHTFGISRELNVIYDGMGKHELWFNHDNISKYWGPNLVYKKIIQID